MTPHEDSGRKRLSMTMALRRQLRDVRSVREVARKTGINNATLSRFARGSISLRLDRADKLARFFRIEVRLPQPRRESRP